jgi:hypothetical protein
MGRKPLPKDERHKRKLEQRMRSYWKYADKERAAALKRYYDKKGDLRTAL